MSWEILQHLPIFFGTIEQNIQQLPFELQNYIYQFCNLNQNKLLKKRKICLEKKNIIDIEKINFNKTQKLRLQKYIEKDFPFYNLFLFHEMDIYSKQNICLNRGQKIF